MGLQHEEFRSNGVGHAVEHLAMSAVPRSHLDRNASIGLTETEFTATGPVAAVVEFLRQVCEGLADLPLTRLEREVGVLDAESGPGDQSRARRGARSAVRLHRPRPGPLGYAASRRAHPGAGAGPCAAARRAGQRGGVPVRTDPGGLRLPLPDGPAPPDPPPVAARAPSPGWVAWDTPWPVLSYLGRTVRPAAVPTGS